MRVYRVINNTNGNTEMYSVNFHDALVEFFRYLRLPLTPEDIEDMKALFEPKYEYIYTIRSEAGEFSLELFREGN